MPYQVMKHLKVLTIFCLIGCTKTTPFDSIIISDKNYTLVFADEFNGKEIDTSKWYFRTDSKHWSTQQKLNVTVNNGRLHLDLKKEKALDKEYTGAGIISKEKFQYGYYEAKIRIPDGNGWHTSFWLMKYNNIATTDAIDAEIEIDIVENDSNDPSGYHIAFHKWYKEHVSVFGQYVKTPNMSQDFFTAGCEYSPEKVVYYRNGDVVKTLDINEFQQGPVNIWLTSIASHLGNTKSVEDTKLPAQASFDYVRFYKLAK